MELYVRIFNEGTYFEKINKVKSTKTVFSLVLIRCNIILCSAEALFCLTE